MSQPQNVTRAGALRQERFNGIIDAAIAEIAQKRIARAQRKKGKRGPLAVVRLGKQAVHDLIRSAVTANRDEVSNALLVGLLRDLRRVARSLGLCDFNFNVSGPQTFERRTQQFAATPAPRCRIHNCKVVLPQGSRSLSLREDSARQNGGLARTNPPGTISTEPLQICYRSALH